MLLLQQPATWASTAATVLKVLAAEVLAGGRRSSAVVRCRRHGIDRGAIVQAGSSATAPRCTFKAPSYILTSMRAALLPTTVVSAAVTTSITMMTTSLLVLVCSGRWDSPLLFVILPCWLPSIVGDHTATVPQWQQPLWYELPMHQGNTSAW